MRVELISQLARVLREIAVWTELNPLVTGICNLTKEYLGSYLVGVAGEPDSPRVRCSADGDRRHITSLQVQLLSRLVFVVCLACLLGRVERRGLADRHVPPGFRVRSADQRIGLDIDHDTVISCLGRLDRFGELTGCC